MYTTRLRRSTRQSSGRYPTEGYDLDSMEVNIVEMPSVDEALRISFEKRRGQYYVVTDAALSTELKNSIRPGDVLAHIGELSTVGLGEVQHLQNYIHGQKTWPLAFDFRRPGAETVDLSSSEKPNKEPAPLTASAVYLPQIPSSRTTVPQVFHDGSEVDLTLDDDDDDVSFVEVSPTSTTPIVRGSSSQSKWFKGQIIKTRYGVGSVFLDSSEGQPLIVLLHWWREYQTGIDGPVKHPVAYLNLETEYVVDCSKETIMQYYRWPLTREEFARFQPGMYLNDTIIDSFLHRLVNEVLPETLRNRVYVLSSYFFSTLEDKKYEAVKKWTKDVDVFEKDFILVPVNDANHWSLAIICYLGRLVQFATPLPDQVATEEKMEDRGESRELSNEESESAPHLEVVSLSSASFLPVGADSTSDSKTAVVTEATTELTTRHQPEESQPCISQTNNGETPSAGCPAGDLDDSLLSVRPRRQTKRVKYLAEEMSVEDQIKAINRTSRSSSSATPPPGPTAKRSRSTSSQQSAQSSTTTAESSATDEVNDSSLRIPVILKLDSTKTHQTRDVAKVLRLWAQSEWEQKKRKPEDVNQRLIVDSKTLSVVAPVVPLQSNSCDCGVFLLQFAEQFLLDRLKVPFNCTVTQRNRKFSKFFGSGWFEQATIPQKRLEMARFVLERSVGAEQTRMPSSQPL